MTAVPMSEAPAVYGPPKPSAVAQMSNEKKHSACRWPYDAARPPRRRRLVTPTPPLRAVTTPWGRGEQAAPGQAALSARASALSLPPLGLGAGQLTQSVEEAEDSTERI